MEYKDYYKILGVEKSASGEAIKKQYRLLARKYHPDVSKEKDAEEKFKEVKEAYEVLKDSKKRQAYDQMGSNWKQGEQFRPPPGWEFNQGGTRSRHPFEDDLESGFGGAGDFSDFFESLFGQRGRAGGHREYSQRGQDQISTINLSLEEAYSGTERTIQFQEQYPTGRAHKTRSIRVKVPAGVVEGQQIRLAGQGGKGAGKGKDGDLYLEVHLEEHPFYTVKERDVYLVLPVTPWEAALGAKVTVPTLGGEVELKIPAASQTGKTLRLKGRGLPGKPAGDQYITLSIHIPEPKTEEEKALYSKMAAVIKYNPRKPLFG